MFPPPRSKTPQCSSQAPVHSFFQPYLWDLAPEAKFPGVGSAKESWERVITAVRRWRGRGLEGLLSLSGEEEEPGAPLAGPAPGQQRREACRVPGRPAPPHPTSAISPASSLTFLLVGLVLVLGPILSFSPIPAEDIRQTHTHTHTEVNFQRHK